MAMMECPRCKFVQPKDKFCANCGIDVEAYKPAPKPIIQQVFSNFYVVIVCACIAIGGTVGFFVMQPDSDSRSEENRLTRDTEFSVQREEELARREEETAKRRQERRQQRQSAIALEEQKRQEAAVAAQQRAKTQQAALKAVQQAQAAPITDLSLRFYEADMNNLNSAFQNGRIVSESNNYRIVVINKSELGGIVSGANSLPGSREMKIVDATPMSMITSFTSAEGNVSWEFGFEVLPRKDQEGSTQVELSGGLYSAGFENLPAALEISVETHTVSGNQVLLLVGLIPHEPIEEPENYGLEGSPMKVLMSQDFMDRQTEFVFVIEPK